MQQIPLPCLIVSLFPAAAPLLDRRMTEKEMNISANYENGAVDDKHGIVAMQPSAVLQRVVASHGERLAASFAASDGASNAAFSLHPLATEGGGGAGLVSVDVVVKDGRLAPALADVGVSVLYYCKRCAFSSALLLEVTDHTGSCPLRQATEEPVVAKHDVEGTPVAVKTEVEESETAGNGEIPGKRKRGRPRKVTADTGSGTTEKRKRGRPRKVVAQTVKRETDGDVAGDSDGGTSATAPSFCERCPTTTLLSTVELAQHGRCHDAGSDELRCYACADGGATRRLWSYLRRHLHGTHGVDFDIRCARCDARLSSHAAFNRHVRVTHMLRCEHCRHTTESRRDAEAHRRCHDPQDAGRWRCYVCGEAAARWLSLHCHLMMAHPGEISPLFACAHCGRAFQHAQRLRRHALACGRGGQLACRVCGGRVHPKGMVAHMRTHAGAHVATDAATDGAEQKCPHCYKKFADFTRLHLHMQFVHAPERMLRALCETCGKSFANAIRLRNHVREVHERVRRQKRVPPRARSRHVCEVCAYSTPDRLRLRNHQQSVHGGVRPYACDRCDYRTNERSDARRHRQRHLGVKPYACDACSYRTDARWLLARHCLSKHGVVLPPSERARKPDDGADMKTEQMTDTTEQTDTMTPVPCADVNATGSEEVDTAQVAAAASNDALQ